MKIKNLLVFAMIVLCNSYAFGQIKNIEILQACQFQKNNNYMIWISAEDFPQKKDTLTGNIFYGSLDQLQQQDMSGKNLGLYSRYSDTFFDRRSPESPENKMNSVPQIVPKPLEAKGGNLSLLCATSEDVKKMYTYTDQQYDNLVNQNGLPSMIDEKNQLKCAVLPEMKKKEILEKIQRNPSVLKPIKESRHPWRLFSDGTVNLFVTLAKNNSNNDKAEVYHGVAGKMIKTKVIKTKLISGQNSDAVVEYKTADGLKFKVRNGGDSNPIKLFSDGVLKNSNLEQEFVDDKSLEALKIPGFPQKGMEYSTPCDPVYGVSSTNAGNSKGKSAIDVPANR